MSPAEAAQHVRSWFAHPVVRAPDTSTDEIETVLKSLETFGTAGNLMSDAQNAALAMAHDTVPRTNDIDFLRFANKPKIDGKPLL